MLRPMPIPPVPTETARIARAAFPKGHPYLLVADELGAVITDELFTDLFSSTGQSAFAPWRLALTAILQFAENLSDRQAADAVRSRIDWKYVLRLELDDPGFDASILCEFRGRLLGADASLRLFETLLTWCRERRLLKPRGRQRTDSTHVLAAVQALNRIELVAATMRATLDSLATADPAWFQAYADSAWIDRYAVRLADDRLPTKQEQRIALATTIGADGEALLARVFHSDAPSWLRDLSAVRVLQRVWIQNYVPDATGLRWRTADDGLPRARDFVSSPYDLDAHYARKRTTQWIGYKVHLTETCDDDLPHLVTHVETTSAPIADGAVTPTIHAALKTRDLLPAHHLVDTGYLDANLLAQSQQEFGVNLIGPTRPDVKWQAQADTGFTAQAFRIDWTQQTATCPAGNTSSSWTPAVDSRSTEVIKIKFSTSDCTGCPNRQACVRSDKRWVRRTLTIRTHAAYEALQAARAREKTADYKREAMKRAGIEGTISQGVRRCGMRRSRYVGLAKTHQQHVLMATALNIVRLGEWLAGTPHAKTRVAPFVRVLRASA